MAQLTALVLLIALGITQGVQPGKRPAAAGQDDLSLYTRMIERVHQGEPYYRVVTDEIRQRGGALKPFLTVRPPTLTVAMAALPSPAWREGAIRVLALASLAAWCARLRLWRLPPLAGVLCLLALASGVIASFAEQAYLQHEAWAGLLISLSLALRRPGHWRLSLLIGLAAALERELAAPYLLAMAVFALYERQFKEGVAWLAGLGVFALALWGHILMIDAQLLATDTASPGWLAIGGWPFVLHAASWNGLVLFDEPWIAVVFPLALLGLIAWRKGPGDRAAFIVLGYVAMFLVLGRRENFYWGLIIAPIWSLGLITAPQALRLLIRRASDGVRRPTRLLRLISVSHWRSASSGAK